MDYLKIILLYLFFLNVALNGQTETFSFEYKHKKLPFGLEQKVPSNLPDVSLALSGGGARGISQIGVLKALEEKGIIFNSIIGTSMGSVVGGLYSAGYSLDDIDSIFKSTDWDDLLAPDRETNRRNLFVDQKITEDKAVLSLRLKGLTPVLPTSIIDGQKLSNYLNLLIINAPIHQSENFDQLRFSYRSVCTDLKTGKPVVLSSGSLSQAMRASSSVSFLLSPVKLDSMILVDGGLVANIPVTIASEMSDFVIAVNTTSELHSETDLIYPWFIADQIVSIPMKLLNEEQLSKADILITPGLGPKASTDFTNIDSLIMAGYTEASFMAQKIREEVDSLFVLRLDQPLIYYKNIIPGNNIPEEAEPFVNKYLKADSVSNHEIYLDLYSLLNTGEFSNMDASLTASGDSVIISYRFQYYPIINQVIVERKPEAASLKSEQPFSDLLGRRFYPTAVANYFIKQLSEIRKDGYSLADVEKVNYLENTGTLIVNFNDGLIDSISIIGNTYTHPTIITREFPFRQGEPFMVGNVEKWLTNLRSTNLFEDINLTVLKEDGKNIIVLRVLEKNSSVIRLGFRIDNENKIQAGIDIRDENLFGSGTELGFLISLGARDKNYILEHKSNRVFDTYLTYKINGYYQIDDVFLYRTDPQESADKFTRSIEGEYRQIYYGGSLSLGTQVGRFGNFIFTGKYQFDELKYKSGLEISPYKIKIVSLKVSSTIDTQDKYPYPDKGIYFYGWYETAQTVLGGDIGFTNIFLDYRYHLTVDDVNTFSPKILMGFGDNTLPLTEQYSLGGQNSFFGMREDEFRGRQAFVSSLEYRYRLPIQIFFDTFFRIRYDLGSIWNVPSQIKFKDLRHGIGATVSLDTPIGPADFSIGRSFLFRKSDSGSTVSFGEVFLYFSIGYYY